MTYHERIAATGTAERPRTEDEEERDEISALTSVLRAACECAVRWGWTEDRVVRLVRVCFRWERDGKIPANIDTEASP